MGYIVDSEGLKTILNGRKTPMVVDLNHPSLSSRELISAARRFIP